MKKIFLYSILSLGLLGSVHASEKDSNDILVNHKGKQYVVKGQEATYPEMVRDLNQSFTARNELNDLFNGFRELLNQNPNMSLGSLGDALKAQVEACEEVSPIFVQFRKFERPKRVEGSIEGTVTIPQLTTIDTVRQVSSQVSANQQVISKTTFVLTPDSLKKLAQKKKNKEESSNQWNYLEDLSEKLGNLSFTFQCNTTLVEGGSEDPVQTLSLIDANVSTKDPQEVLNEQEEKMLVGPNAAAFTVESVKRVFGVFIYAPQGEYFPLKRWGTGSTRAVTQFWDKK